MQITTELSVRAQEFFDCLLASCAYDVKEATGKEVAPKDLYTGFTYTKKLATKTKQTCDVVVELQELVCPSVYECVFDNRRTKTTVRYEVSENEDGIRVEYSETATSSSHFDEYNYKLLSFLYSYRAKKKALTMLKAMESYIISQRHSQELVADADKRRIL